VTVTAAQLGGATTLRAAEDARLVRVTAAGVEFSHPLLRARPGLGGGQLLELLGGGRAEREAHAHRRQQRRVPRPPGRGSQDRPGAGLREERVQQHRARVPRPERPLRRQRPAGGPPPGGRPAPGSGSGSGSASARGSGSRSVPGPAPSSGSGPGAGSGSVNRGSAGGRPASPPGAGACPRGPRPRPTVVFATPSRRPISASLAPCSRHALARADDRLVMLGAVYAGGT